MLWISLSQSFEEQECLTYLEDKGDLILIAAF